MSALLAAASASSLHTDSAQHVVSPIVDALSVGLGRLLRSDVFPVARDVFDTKTSELREVEADLPSDIMASAAAVSVCIQRVATDDTWPYVSLAFTELRTLLSERLACCVELELDAVATLNGNLTDPDRLKRGCQACTKALRTFDSAGPLLGATADRSAVGLAIAACLHAAKYAYAAENTPAADSDAALKKERLLKSVASVMYREVASRGPATTTVGKVAVDLGRAAVYRCAAAVERAQYRADNSAELNIKSEVANLRSARTALSSCADRLKVFLNINEQLTRQGSMPRLADVGGSSSSSMSNFDVVASRHVLLPLAESLLADVGTMLERAERDNGLVYFAKLPESPSDLSTYRAALPDVPESQTRKSPTSSIVGAVGAVGRHLMELTMPTDAGPLRRWGDALARALPAPMALATLYRVAEFGAKSAEAACTILDLSDDPAGGGAAERAPPHTLRLAASHGSLDAWAAATVSSLERAVRDHESLFSRVKAAREGCLANASAQARKKALAQGEDAFASQVAESKRLVNRAHTTITLPSVKLATPSGTSRVAATVGQLVDMEAAAKGAGRVFEAHHKNVTDIADFLNTAAARGPASSEDAVAADGLIAECSKRLPKTGTMPQPGALSGSQLRLALGSRLGVIDLELHDLLARLASLRSDMEASAAKWLEELAALERAGVTTAPLLTAAGDRPVAQQQSSPTRRAKRTSSAGGPETQQVSRPQPRPPAAADGIPQATASSKLHALFAEDDASSA